MNNNFVNHSNTEVKENIVAGIVGAFLFALAGGVIYFLLHLVGFIASISGLVGAVCAVKGYAVFARKETKKGIVIGAVMSLLVIVIAWYFCLAYDIYDAYMAFYEAGEIDFYYTLIESVQVAPFFLADPEIAGPYLGDLGLGLLFCVLGGGSYLFNKFRTVNADNVHRAHAEEAQPKAEPEVQSEENTEEKAEEKAEENTVNH